MSSAIAGVVVVSWYHATASRHVAESLLMQNGKDGSYLLRPSTSRPGHLVISLRYAPPARASVILLSTPTLHCYCSHLTAYVSRTSWVSRYQKGKTSRDLNEARDDRVLGWQWHQLDHMQTICTSLQTDNHTNTSSLNFYRLGALPDAEPTVSKHSGQFDTAMRDSNLSLSSL